jgi:hypothetical protein
VACRPDGLTSPRLRRQRPRKTGKRPESPHRRLLHQLAHRRQRPAVLPGQRHPVAERHAY